jgi:acyl phosphate:glycerol-3-phosphate acyltransferase
MKNRGIRLFFPSLHFHHVTIALTTAVLVVLGYLLGSIPFGYLAGRAKGVDIRKFGSGNIGATNVIRVLGKKIGFPVFILDILKGLLAVMLAWWWCGRQPAFAKHESAGYLAEVLGGLGAVLGHNFTFWLGFRGGKGIATSAGVFLGLAPIVLLAVLVVWSVTLAATRYVAVASMAAGVALPIAVAVQGAVRGAQNWPLLGAALVMAVLAIVRHRSNIQRLRTGTESRFGEKDITLP